MKKLFEKIKSIPRKKIILTCAIIISAVALAVSGLLIYKINKPCEHLLDAGTVIKEATCAELGTKVFICQYCGYSEYEELPLADHVFKTKNVSKATCKDDGKIIHACQVCSLEKEELIPKNEEHNFEYKTVSEPTCTEKGIKEEVCTVCQKTGEITETEVTEHSYTETATISPTCTKTGEKRLTCSLCNQSYTETINAVGHNWKEATCTEAKECTSCGITEGNALGHTVKVGTCSRCGTESYRVSVTCNQTFPRNMSYHTVSITEIYTPTFSYETVSDAETKVTISITGKRIWLKREELSFEPCSMGYYIHDSNGNVVAMGYISADSMKVGETGTFCTSVTLPDGEYTLELHALA